VVNIVHMYNIGMPLFIVLWVIEQKKVTDTSKSERCKYRSAYFSIHVGTSTAYWSVLSLSSQSKSFS